MARSHPIRGKQILLLRALWAYLFEPLLVKTRTKSRFDGRFLKKEKRTVLKAFSFKAYLNTC